MSEREPPWSEIPTRAEFRAENDRLTALNAELVARLRGALYHVESEGDDTLAAMIKETIAKAERQ